ncbi:AlwI family type II restriction endonuclease [Enterococcus faecium]|uniref:AlwI family type II restriction endonuclease n=1 Tax=Enterococcus faecium TaxID=1352 RepID=UPI000CF273E0|nr:AlwI family type II restriction endonuclease [Enterococcus faecium]EGP5220350.1 AlwI family type II restriction endonuclease [Enterococcus faecium]PQE50841.1 AlwI family type II restriction endonuclease [Enterococcus faecium]ROX88658.1 AlwI family type II restriction endonuclease [Enterococcus faecium]ROY62480.1 AlwI family type II restriction endonuclease [Enterococcus faecium]
MPRVRRRKPISFDTTLRNPGRIPQFISVLSEFEGQVIDDKVALELEGEIIRQKIFEPTKATLGTYMKEYNKKFPFVAADQSKEAAAKVEEIYDQWENGAPGSVPLEKIIYLLENTITAHKDRGWKGGWESRIHTQFNFLNELGFVRVVKGEKIVISKNGKLMIHEYSNGYPIEDSYDESFEQSAFLNAFSKYQVNNPYRSNTIEVNFFPLVLNVINYLDEKYQRPGISKQDLPFIITWGNDDYQTLAEYIYQFRNKFGYSTSDELVYEYAMNLLDDSTPNDTIAPATKAFIEQKKRDYKFDKIISETPDEVIRKLRLTMLISLRGAGRFIDINKNELAKIKHVLATYSSNIEFDDDVQKYLEYMGEIDNSLMFVSDAPESQEAKDAKEVAIEKWAKECDWTFLKEEMVNSVEKRPSSHLILKYVKETARLEFLSAIVIKKALPKLKVVANYKADDQGIPFNTASGGKKNQIGADIDVFEENIHAILEPTISKQRSFQVEHELPSIRNHVLGTANKDVEEGNNFKEWFSLFIASNITRDVGDQVALIKQTNGVEIYPWDIKDFVEYSEGVSTIRDYKKIRDYVKPQSMPVF